MQNTTTSFQCSFIIAESKIVTLLRSQSANCPVQDAVVLSGYGPQCSTLQSVHGIQGCERDIVIYNAVRDNSQSDIAVIKDNNCVSVAIAHARLAKIIMGHQELKNCTQEGRHAFQYAV